MTIKQESVVQSSEATKKIKTVRKKADIFHLPAEGPEGIAISGDGKRTLDLRTKPAELVSTSDSPAALIGHLRNKAVKPIVSNDILWRVLDIVAATMEAVQPTDIIRVKLDGVKLKLRAVDALGTIAPALKPHMGPRVFPQFVSDWYNELNEGASSKDSGGDMWSQLTSLSLDDDDSDDSDDDAA